MLKEEIEMEFERLRRRPVYYSTVGMVIVWFVMLFYIALTKIDIEHTKTLIEIERVLQPWREASKYIEREERIKFEPPAHDSLSEKLAEIYRKKRKEIVESIIQREETVNARMTNKPSIAFVAKKQSLIQDWLHKIDDDDTLQKANKKGEKTFKPAKNIFKKFRITQNYLQTARKDETQEDSVYSEHRYPSPIHTAGDEHRNYNDPDDRAKIFFKTIDLEHSTSDSTIQHNTINGASKAETLVPSAAARVSNFPPKAENNALNSKINQTLNEESKTTDELLISLSPNNISVQKSESGYLTKEDSQKFRLSYNETTMLTNLPRTRNQYIDTTSDDNVKNEIGPISKYVDQVYTHDMKEKELMAKKVFTNHEIRTSARAQKINQSATIQHEVLETRFEKFSPREPINSQALITKKHSVYTEGKTAIKYNVVNMTHTNHLQVNTHILPNNASSINR